MTPSLVAQCLLFFWGCTVCGHTSVRIFEVGPETWSRHPPGTLYHRCHKPFRQYLITRHS